MKTNEYIEKVASDLIEAMKTAGTNFMLPWVKDGMPKNLGRLKTKDPYYYGINTFVLWYEKDRQGFKSNIWGTEKQIKDAGGKVKDEHQRKATQVVLWKPFTYKDKYKKDTGDHKKGDTRLVSSVNMRFFWVYNLDQTTLEKQEEKLEGAKVRPDVETYIKNTGAKVEHGGDRCFYVPSKDFIKMVHKDKFKRTADSSATENYYSTFLHELTHWTGHESRLKRKMDDYFGTKGYAFEELVAEMGAAMQCAILGVTSKPKKESAQYLNSWIKGLKDNPKAIMSAVGKAGSAVKYLENLQ